jgi:hypothetical protein
MAKRIFLITVSSIIAFSSLFGFGKVDQAAGAAGPSQSRLEERIAEPASPVTVPQRESQSPSKLSTCPLTRIMPLGDSITVGHSSGVEDDAWKISYRKDLWDTLVANDYNVDFVGSQINGENYPNFDPDHEGHSGIRDDEVASNVYNWLQLHPADVVLLHIGTNALNSNSTDVENILKNIEQYETDFSTHVTVILARIINRITYSATTTQFNNNVEAMALNRIAAGDDIVIVDMEDGAGLIYDYYYADPPGDMYNDLHPYATGYTKMAAVWYAALTNGILSPCSNQPPVIDPIDNQTDSEGDSVSLAVVASDPNLGDQLTYSATGLPSGLNIGSVSGEIQGGINYQAAASSPYSVTVTVMDDGNPPLSSQEQFFWSVNNTNRAPEVLDPEDQSSAEGDGISLPIQSSDPDGDELSFAALGLPPGLDINPLSGIISGTISYTASISSPYAITISVSDDYSPPANTEIGFMWTVTDTNRSPIVANPGIQQNIEAELVDLQIQADDPEGDTLSYTASGLPDGLAIDPVTGLIHGRLSSQSAGHHSVQVVVSDGGEDQDVTIDFIWVVFDRYFLPLLSKQE